MDAVFKRFFPKDGDATAGFYSALRACLPSQGRVLDLGCGDMTALARFRTGQLEVWGADFALHPRLSDARWFRRLHPDGTIPFPPDSFDLIAGLWVLEHVERPGAFLREVSRVLRPGGRLVVLTPDRRHYVTAIARLFHAMPHALTQQVVSWLYRRPAPDTFPTYFRLNTPRELRRSAQAPGLDLVRLRRFANPNYFRFSTTLCRCAVVVDWLLEQLFPGRGRLYFLATLEKRIAIEQSHPVRAA